MLHAFRHTAICFFIRRFTPFHDAIDVDSHAASCHFYATLATLPYKHADAMPRLTFHADVFLRFDTPLLLMPCLLRYCRDMLSLLRRQRHYYALTLQRAAAEAMLLKLR